MVSQSLTKGSFRAVPHRQRFAAKPRPVPCGCYGSGLIYGDDDRAFYCDCKIGIERERQDAAAEARDQWANAIADAFTGGV